MKRNLYILLLLIAMVSCEEVYRPNIDVVDDMLVVEAVLVANQTPNKVLLYRSRSFDSKWQLYPPVSGANVYLIDDLGNSLTLREVGEGNYQLDEIIKSERSYHLSIELEGDVYESGVQSVPDLPQTDSVYPDFATRVRATGDANSKDDIEKEVGIQIYTDIAAKNGTSYYRFAGKKLIQYQDSYDTVIMMPPPVTMPIFIWRTMGLSGTFNIAGPPAYSTSRDIVKHPLEFFEQNYLKFMPDTLAFNGWIYTVYQYGLNEDTYNYYKDMNSQLNAEGKIFDPVFVQVQGNIQCTTDQKKIVLGNFEISSFREYRYFLMYYRREGEIRFRPIPHFYDIPSQGYVKDIMPDFWEYFTKPYPNE